MYNQNKTVMNEKEVLLLVSGAIDKAVAESRELITYNMGRVLRALNPTLKRVLIEEGLLDEAISLMYPKILSSITTTSGIGFFNGKWTPELNHASLTGLFVWPSDSKWRDVHSKIEEELNKL